MSTKIYYFYRDYIISLDSETRLFEFVYKHLLNFSNQVVSYGINGNETMDAIMLLYVEVICLCFLIVFIVVDVLIDIEIRYTSVYFFWSKGTINIDETDEDKLLNPFSGLVKQYTKSVESCLDSFFLVFPSTIIFYIIIPTLGFLYNKDINLESFDISFSVDIIGRQWYWSYEYQIDLFGPDSFLLDIDAPFHKRVAFDSILNTDSNTNRLLEVDHSFVIPAYANIGLSLTSYDVIHSWAVPQLGIKIDTIPGRLSTCVLHTYTIGTFIGQCSELCGVNHGFMPIVVEAVSLEVFFDWYYEIYCSDTGFTFFNIL